MEIEQDKTIFFEATGRSCPNVAIFKVSTTKNDEPYFWELRVPFDHINEEGKMMREGRIVSGRIKQEDADQIEQSLDFIGADWNLTKADAHTNADGHTTRRADNDSAVHATDEDGRPLCGTELNRKVEKGERWDPWVKTTKEPKTVESVFVPTFQDVTCKRCKDAE